MSRTLPAAALALVTLTSGASAHAQAWHDGPAALTPPTPSTGATAAPAPAPAPATVPDSPPPASATPPAPAEPFATGPAPPPPPPGTQSLPDGYDAPRYPAPRSPNAPRSHLYTDEGAPIKPTTATRLRVIDESLTVLAARGTNNILDGILTITFGGLSLGLSFATNASEQQLALRLWGTSGVARGIVQIAVPPNLAEPTVRFSNMPMRSVREVDERLAFGERTLEHFARRLRIARILDASIAIASGLAVVPIFLSGNDGFDSEDPFDYIVIVSSGISVLTGLISLATRTDAERRWTAYQDLRDRLATESADDRDTEDEVPYRSDPFSSLAPPHGPRFAVGAAPTRGGGAFVAELSF